MSRGYFIWAGQPAAWAGYRGAIRVLLLIFLGALLGCGGTGSVNSSASASSTLASTPPPNSPPTSPSPAPPQAAAKPEYLYFGKAFTVAAVGPQPAQGPAQYFGFDIDPTTGAIGPAEVPGSPYSPSLSGNGPGPNAVVANRWLYFSERGFFDFPWPDDIMGFAINSPTGALSPIPGANPLWPGAAENIQTLRIPSLVPDPLGRFLFATTTDPTGAMVFRINGSTGVLSQTWPPPPLSSASQVPVAAIAVDPSGSFLYGTSYATGDIVGYRIQTDGTLSLLPGAPIAIGPIPPGPCSCVIVDPAGRYLYAISSGFLPGNSYDNKIYAFSIDRNTGALSPLAGSPFPTGLEPVSITMTPSGQYVYVAHFTSPFTNTVSGYRVEAGGKLELIPGSPFPISYAEQVSIAPTGLFAYVGQDGGTAQSQRIAVYSIDPATGALTATGAGIEGGPGFSMAEPK